MPRKQKRTARSKNGAQHTRTGKTACILQENADIVALVAGQLFSYDELALLAAVCKSLRAFVWDATRFRKSHLHYTAFMPLEPQRMPHALLVRDDTEKDFRVGVAWDTRTYAEMRAGLGMVASRLHNAQKVMVSVVGPHATVMQAKERSVLFLGTAQLVLDMSLFPEMSGVVLHWTDLEAAISDAALAEDIKKRAVKQLYVDIWTRLCQRGVRLVENVFDEASSDVVVDAVVDAMQDVDTKTMLGLSWFVCWRDLALCRETFWRAVVGSGLHLGAMFIDGSKNRVGASGSGRVEIPKKVCQVFAAAHVIDLRWNEFTRETLEDFLFLVVRDVGWQRVLDFIRARRRGATCEHGHSCFVFYEEPEKSGLSRAEFAAMSRRCYRRLMNIATDGQQRRALRQGGGLRIQFEFSAAEPIVRRIPCLSA